jgi:hypothetical protein
MMSDMVIDYAAHLKAGRVWRVEIQLPMQDAPDDVPDFLNVSVDVVAPNKHLAQYIVSTIYTDFESLRISDEPLS